ncbi:MAG: energy transducer TonB [Acidobacteriota bacterium]|nr:MAG: energy transducer TonB [Acidobacteriota bacterium]
MHFTAKTVKFAAAFAVVLLFAASAAAHRIAIIAPDKAVESVAFAEKLTNAIRDVDLIDGEMARAAFEAVAPENAFNMTRIEARRAGSAIGCSHFVVLRSAVQRRTSFEKKEYYEAYAVVFVVSSRTGRLLLPILRSAESSSSKDAFEKLLTEIPAVAKEIETEATSSLRRELAEPPPPAMEEPPDEGTAAARGFRAPVPYRRIRPEYTRTANLYDIAATVEITVDLDEKGKILRTEIERWAGFGLEESVEKAVRSMNWRPAERGGKQIPMRFLLRYNFTKLPRDADREQ